MSSASTRSSSGVSTVMIGCCELISSRNSSCFLGGLEPVLPAAIPPAAAAGLMGCCSVVASSGPLGGGLGEAEELAGQIGGIGFSVAWMIRFKPRSPQERRWLKVLGTLNEFQARLFLASLALDQGRG